MKASIQHQMTNNLYAFYNCFVARNYEDRTYAPHIKELSKILTNIAYNQEYKSRLCVAMPPQHSKSSLITVAFTVWLMIHNPKLRILVVNAEKDLSSTFGIQIRQLIYNIGHFYNLNVSRVKSSNTYLMFEDNDGNLLDGSIQLTGASGGITGRPTDFIIVDDAYKGLAEEFTPSALNKKWNWYTTLIEQRVRPTTKLIVLHTRWHSLDIQGRIKADPEQAKKYEFVEYPAINTDGQPLWDYYGLDFYLDKQRTMGERQFQAIYQQKPLDLTSNFFYTDHIIWEEQPLNKYYEDSCRSWDMAYTLTTGDYDDSADYTAGIAAYRVNKNHYLFTDLIYGQFGKKNIKIVQDTARQDGVNQKILIETGTKGGAAKELFRLWNKDYLQGYNCEQSEPIGTKADRATALSNAMYDKKIHVYINDKELRQIFISQFKAFPNGQHDDIVDACSYAYTYLMSKQGSDVYGTSSTTY